MGGLLDLVAYQTFQSRALSSQLVTFITTTLAVSRVCDCVLCVCVAESVLFGLQARRGGPEGFQSAPQPQRVAISEVCFSQPPLYPLLYALPVVNTELRTTLLICARWWCSGEGLCYCILSKDRKGNFPYTVLRYITIFTRPKIRLRFTKWRKYFSIGKHLNRN